MSRFSPFARHNLDQAKAAADAGDSSTAIEHYKEIIRHGSTDDVTTLIADTIAAHEAGGENAK